MKPEHRVTLFPPSTDVITGTIRIPALSETEAWLRVHLAKWSLVNRVQYENEIMSIRTSSDHISIDFRFPLKQFHISHDGDKPSLILFSEGFAVKQRPAKSASEASTLFDDSLTIQMATDVSDADLNRLGHAFQALSNEWAHASLGNTRLFGT